MLGLPCELRCLKTRTAALGRRGLANLPCLQVRGLPSALTCAASRLLCRAAWFLGMMRFPAIASMVACSALSAAPAAAWSAAPTAFCTFLMALRSIVRRLTLAARCLTDFLARLAACLVLAMVIVGPKWGVRRAGWCNEAG